jgi:stage II sporulation protein D
MRRLAVSEFGIRDSGFGIRCSWLVQRSGFRVLVPVLVLVLFCGFQNREPRAQSRESRIPNPESRSVRVGVQRAGGGYTVSDMPLETYVARVLAGEAARDSQPAALEALAITIRTFALANPGRHRADGFDLCDQTHCQVVRTATAATDRASQATAGRVLVREGAPASVYYTASCGGRTELPSDVWPGHEDPPYLPSKADDACDGAPAWTAELHERDLLRALRSAGFRGDTLKDVTIASRNTSGRVATLKLVGLRPDRISGQDLRMAVGRTLGWQHIKSTAFDVRRKDEVYRFSGRGSGHGVGLCVIGSARLAERGVGAEGILRRYFPGLEVSAASAVTSAARPAAPQATATRAAATPSPTPDVLVALPDDDEGERATIVRQTITSRDDLARVLGVSPPAQVTLRFHPTTDDYESATGRAWFTSATLVNGELHLLPLATLRERGVLDRTIRHELVHVMTDGVLGRRPLWVREGAAIYFAGEQPIPGEPAQRPAFKPQPRASCPDDNELLRPVSVGALSNAYARARACFAKQIDAGRSWREIR